MSGSPDISDKSKNRDLSELLVLSEGSLFNSKLSDRTSCLTTEKPKQGGLISNFGQVGQVRTSSLFARCPKLTVQAFGQVGHPPCKGGVLVRAGCPKP